MHEFAHELEIGRSIARRAGEIAMRHFRTGLPVESKADRSPVTAADRECEEFIARELLQAFPDDGLLGEEGAQKASTNGRRWIVDPIDGTRDFVRGNPVWSVLIGLELGDEVVAGFAFLPALNDLYSAARGAGAFVNGQRIQASAISTVEQSVLCLDSFTKAASQPFAGELLAWMEEFWAVRSMGGCLDALMVARGQAEIWIETNGKPWDFAALKIIAEEAGARFFDFEGKRTIYGGNCVICAPALEEAVRLFVSRPHAV